MEGVGTGPGPPADPRRALHGRRGTRRDRGGDPRPAGPLSLLLSTRRPGHGRSASARSSAISILAAAPGARRRRARCSRCQCASGRTSWMCRWAGRRGPHRGRSGMFCAACASARAWPACARSRSGSAAVRAVRAVTTRSRAACRCSARRRDFPYLISSHPVLSRLCRKIGSRASAATRPVHASTPAPDRRAGWRCPLLRHLPGCRPGRWTRPPARLYGRTSPRFSSARSSHAPRDGRGGRPQLTLPRHGVRPYQAGDPVPGPETPSGETADPPPSAKGRSSRPPATGTASTPPVTLIANHPVRQTPARFTGCRLVCDRCAGAVAGARQVLGEPACECAHRASTG